MDKLTKTAFQTLCSENLIWIQQWPDCLEKRHIEDILIDCPKLYYDDKVRIASLEVQLKGREWISVEDRLPETDADVLIRIPVCSRFNVESGNYKGEGQFVGAWCERRGKGCAYDVTHWMPLPEAPQ